MVVTEFPVSPLILCVVVEKVPDSVAVCGPTVIGPVSALDVVVDVMEDEDNEIEGPPSSLDSSGLFGYTLLEMLYVSPL